MAEKGGDLNEEDKIAEHEHWAVSKKVRAFDKTSTETSINSEENV